jgi:LPS-assembly lipoprotein
VARGTVTSFASYDRSAQRFANIRAARDAEIRDARTLADQLTTQVAAQLGQKAAKP